MFLNFYLSIALSFFIAFSLTPLVKNFFIKKGWIENIFLKQKKSHNATASRSAPRGGGLPIFFAILINSLVFLPIDKHILAILLASFVVLLVGLWDDIKDISPRFRFLTNILVAVIIVASGIGISFVSNPFGGIIDLSFLRIDFNFFGPHSIWLISDLLAIFWIVFL
ncbi:hypothetical protein DRH14_00310 [Candidatus Shapirobacteria bacterium]|nr:MAG: hypothetical protein DRH14_00310 [Candidatus Shapirobacteria bacterium]